VPTNFSDLGVRADIVACLTELGVVEPYPIQSAVLPDALAGLDLFGQSPTGSGKTLAFIIPLLMRIGRAAPRRPRALVLAPTRELAEQIAEVARPLARIVGRRVVSVYGGTGYRDQLNALSRGVDLVVGCPGRLTDLRDRGALDLSEVEIVVVD
jgi:superfamily II DNA/RNA helicase